MGARTSSAHVMSAQIMPDKVILTLSGLPAFLRVIFKVFSRLLRPLLTHF